MSETMGSSVHIPDNILNPLMDALQRYRPDKAFVFGSFGRDDWDEYSDVDLVVIKETELGFLDRIRAFQRSCNLPVSVDVLIYTPEEYRLMKEAGNAFIEMVEQEGVLIYVSPGEKERGETLDASSPVRSQSS